MTDLRKLKLYRGAIGSMVGMIMLNNIAPLFVSASNTEPIQPVNTDEEVPTPIIEEYTVDQNETIYGFLQQYIVDNFSKSVNFTDYQKTIQGILPYIYLPYFDINNMQRYIDYKVKNPNLGWIDAIIHVGIGLDNPHYSNIKTISNPEALNVLVNKYNQIPSDYVPSDLVDFEGQTQLRSEVANNLKILFDEAAKEAIYLFTKHDYGYRSYAYQKKNYDGKVMYNGVKNTDKANARPGHTEHQLGLAVDICSAQENDFKPGGKYYAVGQWLASNAYKYGFIIRYPDGKENVTGYIGEPWHIRYLGKELATSVYNSGLTYDEYYARYIASPTLKKIPNVSVDMKNIAYTKSPYLINGTTYLPFKETLNSLGYDVTWDASTNLTNISNGYVTYKHKVGTNEFICNDKKIYIDNPTFVMDGVTYSAVRGICTLAGAEVSYEGSTDTVRIVSFKNTDKYQVWMQDGYVKEEPVPIDTLAMDPIKFIQDNGTYMNKTQLSDELAKYGSFTIDGMPVSEYNKAMSIEWVKIAPEGEFVYKDVDLSKVMRYEDIKNLLYNLAKCHGVELYSIGKSVRNRDIFMLNVALPKEGETQEDFNNRPLILLSGSIHAQEGAGCEYLIKCLNDMMIAAQNDPYLMALLQSVRIQVVPLINPDGREMVLDGEITSGKCNANGVDLNRNFPSVNAGTLAKGVALINNFKTKPDPEHMYYAGPYLGSEPETKAVIKWLLANATKAICHIDLHQQGSILYADKPFLSEESDLLSISFSQLVNSALNQKYPRQKELSTYGINGDGGTITDYFRSIRDGMVYSQKYGRLVMMINGVETPLLIFKDVDNFKGDYKPLNKNCRVLSIEIGPGQSYLRYGATATKLKKELYYNHNWDEFISNVVVIVLGEKVKEIKAELEELAKNDLPSKSLSDKLLDIKASLTQLPNAKIKLPVVTEEEKKKMANFESTKFAKPNNSKFKCIEYFDYRKKSEYDNIGELVYTKKY